MRRRLPQVEKHLRCYVAGGQGQDRTADLPLFRQADFRRLPIAKPTFGGGLTAICLSSKLGASRPCYLK